MTDPVQEIAKVLKRLYPQNPDNVLGAEARVIHDALAAAGLLRDPVKEAIAERALACKPNGSLVWRHTDHVQSGDGMIFLGEEVAWLLRYLVGVGSGVSTTGAET